MKRHNFFSIKGTTLALVLCGFPLSISLADTLISPPLYVKGGPVNGFATCRIFQHRSVVGDPPISVSIYASNNTTPLPLVFNTCGRVSMLNRNQFCSYSARILGNLAYICKFSSDDTLGARYTGEIEIQDSQNNVLAREAMQR